MGNEKVHVKDDAATDPVAATEQVGPTGGMSPGIPVVEAATPGWKQRVLEVYATLPSLRNFVKTYGDRRRAEIEYCVYLFAQRAQIKQLLSQGYALLPHYDAVFEECVLVKVPIDEELRKELERRVKLIEKRLKRVRGVP